MEIHLGKNVTFLLHDVKTFTKVDVQVMQTVVDRLYSKKAIWNSNAQSMSKYALLQAREQWRNSNTCKDRVNVNSYFVHTTHSVPILNKLEKE